MRLLAFVFLAALAAPSAVAQPARIGRLSLLDSLSTRYSCKDVPPPSALLEAGVRRLVFVTDSAGRRLLTLGVDQQRRPVYFDASMGTQAGRRGESERIAVHFERGRISQGQRTAITTGTPARLSDDRTGPLFAQDTARVMTLSQQILRRCR